MPETVATLALVCTGCGATARAKSDKNGRPKMPRAKGGYWKRVDEQCYCPACVESRWSLRALALPIRGEPLQGGTLDELWTALWAAWDQCIQLQNWAVNELAKRDRSRRPGEDLQGKTFKAAAPAPRPYLYPEAAALFPDLSSQAVTSMLKAAEGTYNAKRYDVFWRFDASLPRCRRAPLSLSNQAWRAEWREIEETDKDGNVKKVRAPVVTFPLAGRRWAVRLRLGSGEHARRAAASFEQLVNGTALQGELAIYRKKSSTGAHRSTRAEKVAGGGNQKRVRLMFKLVARFSRGGEHAKVRRGTLNVWTARNCLFVASMPGWEDPWLLHADALRGLVASHRYRLQKLADDTKAERRRPRRRRIGMQGYLDTITANYRDALKSRIEYVCSQLVGLANRCGVKTIRYDDTDRRFCDELAWAQICTLDKQKRPTGVLSRQAERLGIEIVYVGKPTVASGEAVNESPGTAGDEK